MDLSPDGRPEPALRLLDLDDFAAASPGDVATVARHLGRWPTPILATALQPVSGHLGPLLSAATCTVVGPDAATGDRRTVLVEDPVAARERLRAAVEHAPQTATALDQLLRQTELLPVLGGLAAEAATYSMLLTGQEFRAWLADRTVVAPATPTGRPLVALRREGDALHVQLDHPERRNALSFALRDELYDALELAHLDGTITRVHITGAGPGFCSGGDLAEFGTATDVVAAYLVRVLRGPWRLLHHLSDKVHVHVHGASVGAGLEVAAFAGHVSATPDATFRLPEVGMGLVPGAGGTVSVVRRIGRWRAAWMMLDGGDVGAAQARAWGLVDEVVDP